MQSPQTLFALFSIQTEEKIFCRNLKQSGPMRWRYVLQNAEKIFQSVYPLAINEKLHGWSAAAGYTCHWNDHRHTEGHFSQKVTIALRQYKIAFQCFVAFLPQYIWEWLCLTLLLWVNSISEKAIDIVAKLIPKRLSDKYLMTSWWVVHNVTEK